MTFLLVNFAVKNAMFNLNENNRFVMAQHLSDMRIGVNGMCGQVRAVGLDPTNGDVYIFVGSSRKIMKLLHWERGGFAMYYKRLEQGCFHPRIFLRQGIGFRVTIRNKPFFFVFFLSRSIFLKNVRPLAHEFIPPMQGLLPTVH
ncbi:MAG: IS66 family insertion sequence element accessory protein TnpB [Bacteroidales bacterium]|nr:IS66 family insertion sequence element accessory protein TnpB [Bacteroidales bacterium]